MARRDILKIAVMAVVIIAFVLLVDRIGNMRSREETQIVEDAVRRAALTCYAVEGGYPDTLDYLRENYQLAYDENQYFVTYRAFASNMMPDIYVVERGATGQ